MEHGYRIRKRVPIRNLFIAEESPLLRYAYGLCGRRAMWEQRSSWIGENLPTFETRGKASSELISRVDTVSKQYGVTIDTKELIEAPTEEELELEGGYYDSAGLKIEISGNEESVVKWVHSLQQPNKFIGVSGLKIEPDADSGLLRCEAKVRLWYGGE
ncbi:MAG: hypothetical protein ACKVJU_06855 [Verrucomicrobiales bacterium]|mgnify:CR=1 FL=1